MPRERAAVSALFLANGYVVGNWAPKIPLFKADLGIDEAALGLMILAFGIGSLITMPLIGAVITREGRGGGDLDRLWLAPLLLVLTLMPGPWTAAGALVLLGGLVGGMDVAMNANAVAVERRMRRAIMSSCHAWWSVGALIGAATGGVLIGRFGPLGHSAAVFLVTLGVVFAAASAVLADPPAAKAVGEKRGRALPNLLALLVGMMALFSMIPEGAVLDWSALYLQQELGASVEAAGFAFAAFSATMAVMRFSGDAIRDRLGAVLTLRLSTVVAGTGLLMAAFAGSVPVAAAGFALAGLGSPTWCRSPSRRRGTCPGCGGGRHLGGELHGLFRAALRAVADRLHRRSTPGWGRSTSGCPCFI